MPRDTCYFDGRCGMCRRTVRWLRFLDWLGRLEFRDMTTVAEAELPFPMEQAVHGMPMRTRDGRALIGFPAVRRALLQTPLGAIPALVLYLPGVSAIGARVYRRVVTHRRRDQGSGIRCQESGVKGARSGLAPDSCLLTPDR